MGWAGELTGGIAGLRKAGCYTRICLVSTLGMRIHREEPSHQLCCRVGDETEGLDLEERQER